MSDARACRELDAQLHASHLWQTLQVTECLYILSQHMQMKWTLDPTVRTKKNGFFSDALGRGQKQVRELSHGTGD